VAPYPMIPSPWRPSSRTARSRARPTAPCARSSHGSMQRPSSGGSHPARLEAAGVHAAARHCGRAGGRERLEQRLDAAWASRDGPTSVPCSRRPRAARPVRVAWIETMYLGRPAAAACRRSPPALQALGEHGDENGAHRLDPGDAGRAAQLEVGREQWHAGWSRPATPTRVEALLGLASAGRPKCEQQRVNAGRLEASRGSSSHGRTARCIEAVGFERAQGRRKGRARDLAVRDEGPPGAGSSEVRAPRERTRLANRSVFLPVPAVAASCRSHPTRDADRGPRWTSAAHCSWRRRSRGLPARIAARSDLVHAR